MGGFLGSTFVVCGLGLYYYSGSLSSNRNGLAT